MCPVARCAREYQGTIAQLLGSIESLPTAHLASSQPHAGTIRWRAAAVLWPATGPVGSSRGESTMQSLEVLRRSPPAR
jgi:hypothetical protein